MGPSRIQCSVLIQSIVGSGWSDVTNPIWGVESSCWMVRWCFQTVVLEKTLESPLDSKESEPVHPKGNQSWIFIGRTDAEPKLQYFGHPMQRADSLEKTLKCWERLRAGKEGFKRRWDGWMAPSIEWTWVWANSKRQWRIGKPDVLQSMGLQSAGRDWVIEQWQREREVFVCWVESTEKVYTYLMLHSITTYKVFSCILKSDLCKFIWNRHNWHSAHFIGVETDTERWDDQRIETVSVKDQTQHYAVWLLAWLFSSPHKTEM